MFAGGKLEDYQWSYVALFVVVLVIFAGPMLIFVPKLLVLKQRGLMEYGTSAAATPRRSIASGLRRLSLAMSPCWARGDIQSLADLGNSFEIIRKMRIVPVELSDFLAMVLPGLIPALPLAAIVMPVGEIIKGLLKLVA